MTRPGRLSRKARRAGPCPRCHGWIWIGARIIGIPVGGKTTWVCVGCALALASTTAERRQVLGKETP